MHEYRIARKVLMANGLRMGTGLTKVKLDGWLEDFIVQQRDDCVGCATIKIGWSGESFCLCRCLSLTKPFFAWPCTLSDRPPTLSWIITWKGMECRYMMRIG